MQKGESFVANGCLFVLLFNTQVNNYGHVETVS